VAMSKREGKKAVVLRKKINREPKIEEKG